MLSKKQISIRQYGDLIHQTGLNKIGCWNMRQRGSERLRIGLRSIFQKCPEMVKSEHTFQDKEKLNLGHAQNFLQLISIETKHKVLFFVFSIILFVVRKFNIINTCLTVSVRFSKVNQQLYIVLHFRLIKIKLRTLSGFKTFSWMRK